MEPSSEGEIKFTATSPTQGLSFPTMSSSLSVNYDRVTPITLTLGYDHSYNNGLVLGVHFMRTLATKLNTDADTLYDIDDFYLQSISFGIGYEWK